MTLPGLKNFFKKFFAPEPKRFVKEQIKMANQLPFVSPL